MPTKIMNQSREGQLAKHLSSSGSLVAFEEVDSFNSKKKKYHQLGGYPKAPSFYLMQEQIVGRGELTNVCQKHVLFFIKKKIFLGDVG